MPKKIVLIAPEIPGNTGSIGRTCLALNYELILIKPYGFSLDEKSVRRAGLDYWKHLNVKEYDSFEDFLDKESPVHENMVFFTKNGKSSYLKTDFGDIEYLIFGKESSGIDQSILKKYKDRTLYMPILNNEIRSLNLASAVTAVAFESLRQSEAN